jgi:hypothetical protein
MLNIPPKVSGDDGWFTPHSSDSGARKYPYCHTTQTESGHVKEMDDSPGNERIKTQHRTGTYYEMMANGDHVHQIVGNGFEIIIKDRKVLVKGTCSITVNGDSNIHVLGDSVTSVEGNMHLDVHGNSTITTGGDVNISSSGEVDIQAGALDGDIYLSAPGGVHVKGDLTVSGDIIGESNISATLNSTAGLKLFSNQGMETWGGLHVGFAGVPVTIPGTITSTVAVTSPTSNHGVVNTVQAFAANISTAVEEVAQEVAGNITDGFIELGSGLVLGALPII